MFMNSDGKCECLECSDRTVHVDVQSTQQPKPQVYGREKSKDIAVAHTQKQPAQTSRLGNCLYCQCISTILVFVHLRKLSFMFKAVLFL